MSAIKWSEAEITKDFLPYGISRKQANDIEEKQRFLKKVGRLPKPKNRQPPDRLTMDDRNYFPNMNRFLKQEADCLFIHIQRTANSTLKQKISYETLLNRYFKLQDQYNHFIEETKRSKATPKQTTHVKAVAKILAKCKTILTAPAEQGHSKLQFAK